MAKQCYFSEREKNMKKTQYGNKISFQSTSVTHEHDTETRFFLRHNYAGRTVHFIHTVASLGSVSPGAATDCVTLFS